MTDMAELAARIRTLEDIEAIRQLKAKYWRCVDKKLWEEREEVYAENIELDMHPFRQYEGSGREYVRMRREQDKENPRQYVHSGHSSEIEITGETTALGTWAFQDIIIDEKTGDRINGSGHYHEEYLKENGQWRIKKIRLDYIVHEKRQEVYY
ncbi:nuclear transport factor 2 family protein [Thermodesulfobacteriota bacterium]